MVNKEDKIPRDIHEIARNNRNIRHAMKGGISPAQQAPERESFDKQTTYTGGPIVDLGLPGSDGGFTNEE